MSLKNNFEISKHTYTKEVGFAEAPARVSLRRKNKSKTSLNYLLSLSFYLMLEPSQPLSLSMFFTPQKKREGKILVYFRFLTIQKPAITATATITAASIMAISVVIMGASVGSGSIAPPGDVASSTPIAVSEYELK